MSQHDLAPPCSPEMTSPVPSGDPREARSDMSQIAFLWRDLASMDRQSPEFLHLLSSLTTGGNQSQTIELRGAEARDTLGIMDEVFGAGKVLSERERGTLNTMRKLAYNSGQVPPRYQVNRRSLRREEAIIAAGTFAEVRRGKLDNKAVAIRTLRIDQKTNGDKHQKLFCKECIIWMKISHPNLLPLIAIDIDSQTGQYSMISELMTNGNIREYIRQNTANRHRLLEDIAAGLCYLHEHDIVHGDLKANNILITNETPPRACLADFGLSTLAPSTLGATATDTAGGTPLYMAPELVAPSIFGCPSARPTKPADIYALGMVILEVLTGALPFSEKGWVISEVTYRVVNGERPTKPDDAEQVGLGGRTWELVEECWMQQPARRPKIEQVLGHLTRVAASSTVVGPTPEIVLSAPESDSSSEINPFNGAITEKDTPDSPLSTVSAASMINTLAPSTVTSVTSRGSGGSHRPDVKPPSGLHVPSPLERLLHRRSTPNLSPPSPKPSPAKLSALAKNLQVESGNLHHSTIPLPILFAMKPPKPDRFGFLDKLNPKHAMDLFTSNFRGH